LELPAHLELTPAWRELRTQLRGLVGDTAYDIWLSPIEVADWDGRVVVLQAPAATQAWVATRFGRMLERSIRGVFGSAVQVAFAAPTTQSRTAVATDRAPEPIGPSGPPSFNPRWSFDQFIIGRGNRLAHAAALAVAELPGQAYNPLFLYAPSGLGKTHLLHAIGNYVLAFGGGATVRYTTVESFTNHFLTALHQRSVDRFKHAYRNADVLLIDDVQFLASKAKTEEEFFHTFNTLYETGRQLVLTCDRLPRQLTGIEERLRERFESGLVAEITPPDFATRLTILRKRAALDQIPPADPTVLELIADRVTDNVRALEGVLIRIVAQHSLTGHPIDVELARSVLDEVCPSARPTGPSLIQIQAGVASFYEVSVEELVSATRKARIAWARQVAIHLARDLTQASLNEIGGAFGGRNHATVLHACRRVSDRLAGDPHLAGEVSEIRASLAAGHADRVC
jgi:chromosomal replication initiator protein